MNGLITNNILIGLEKLRTKASDFEHIFRIIEAPATGRWPGLLIWMETFTEYEPWGVLIERNGEAIAAAILTRYQRFGIWRIGKPGGTSDQVRFGALDDDAATMLAQTIYLTISGFGGPWMLEIPDLPHPDTVVNHLQAFLPCSQNQLKEPELWLLFAPGAPLNNYISRNTRSSVAKALNRIKRENIRMTQEWTRDLAQIKDLLPQILDIYQRRDYQLRETSPLDNPSVHAFIVAFVTEHSKQGLIDLFTIRLDGKIAAYAVCLLDNGIYSVLLNRVSPEWLRYSPGTIANAEVVRHAFEDSHSRGVNWRGGPERYKLSGEVTLIPRQTLYAWSSPTTRLACKLLQYKRLIPQCIICCLKKIW